MNKFVTTALAVAAAGSLSHADPGEDDWLELDSEINDLATALSPSQGDGMGWAALLRITYAYSDDDVANGGSGTNNDISGFYFDDVDLAFWGAVGNYGWRISADVDDNDGGVGAGEIDIVLEDAHVFFDCGEWVTAMVGQMKPNVLRSGYIDPENQLFIDRTALGSTVDFWDIGVGATGTYEDFQWWVEVLDGAAETLGTGSEADHLYVIRLEWNFGAGAGMAEGALGGNDELNFTLGGFYVHNDTGGIGENEWDLYGFDVNGNFNQFGFGAEFADFGDDVVLATSSDYGFQNASGAALYDGNNTPWNITASFLLNPEWEFGVRYEDTDNDDDTTSISGVVNWYRSGHNAKWQAQITDWDSDSGGVNSDVDGLAVQIGLVVGASR